MGRQSRIKAFRRALREHLAKGAARPDVNPFTVKQIGRAVCVVARALRARPKEVSPNEA